MADFFIQVTLKEEQHKKEKESLWLPLFLAFVADSAAPIWYFYCIICSIRLAGFPRASFSFLFRPCDLFLRAIGLGRL